MKLITKVLDKYYSWRIRGGEIMEEDIKIVTVCVSVVIALITIVSGDATVNASKSSLSDITRYWLYGIDW